MTEKQEKEQKYYVINQMQLVALQEFIGGLTLPWKQTNPYMQLLISLKEIKVQQGPPPGQQPQPSLQAISQAAAKVAETEQVD